MNTALSSALVPLDDGTSLDLAALPGDTVVALDVSGGVYSDTRVPLQQIFDVCVSLGLDVVTFDHEVQVFRSQQVSEDGILHSGGGTNFRPVVMYVEANREHASRVLVVTDGHGAPVSPSLPERWTWLLTPDHATYGGSEWLTTPSSQMQLLQLR